MFKKIVVAFITKQFKEKAFLVGLGIAQKFDGSINVVDCVYKKPPKFAFFETKADEKLDEKTKERISKTLKKFEKMGADVEVPVKTKIALINSITDWLVDFVHEHRTDLLIIDHPHLSEFEENHYDDIIKSVTNEVKIPILLLRS